MTIETHNTVLVVVDVQGKLARIAHDSDTLIHNVQVLIRGMKVLGVPVIVTEQYPQGLGHTVEEIQQELEGVEVIEKSAFSCCGEPTFMASLMNMGRHNVLLCGIEAHVCVYQTARDLLNNGVHPHLVIDAVSSRTVANKELGIRKIESIGGLLTGTEMALFELLRESGTENFKTISRLVK
jgi:nicotinamidase-related amidase